MHNKYDSLFATGRIDRLRLKNRVVLAPMTRTSATEDGEATAQMASYYARFAKGGFALLITEGTYIDKAFSQGYRGQPGIATKKQVQAWRTVADAVHEYRVPIFIQLMHAGALSQYSRIKKRTVGPSAIRPKGAQLPLYGGRGPYAVPKQLTKSEIFAIVDNFADASERATEAGFDGIEIHGANGYLIDEFITDYTNRRTDDFGGSLQNRLRFPQMVIAAVKQRVGRDVAVGIRLSQSKVNDDEYRWESLESAGMIFEAMETAGADFIEVASHDATAPIWEREISFGSLAKQSLSVPIIANGKLHAPTRAESFLASGQADFISLAKGALANPDWVYRVRSNEPLAEFDSKILLPRPTLDNEESWWAEQKRAA